MREIKMAVDKKENEESGDELFESRLKEILCAGSEEQDRCRNEKDETPFLINHQIDNHPEKRLSSIAEIIIRIVAAIVVIGLLICFGIQTAFR